jgi:hypothetical protein
MAHGNYDATAMDSLRRRLSDGQDIQGLMHNHFIDYDLGAALFGREGSD